MSNEATFKYKGVDVTFCGFYEGKFAFYANNKAIFISCIGELDKFIT